MKKRLMFYLIFDILHFKSLSDLIVLYFSFFVTKQNRSVDSFRTKEDGYTKNR